MKHTMKTLSILATLASGLMLASCVGHGHLEATARVDAPPPTLVHIGPGVWVVEDFHRPVFYHSGWYWLYSDGVWMRSHVHTGSFVRVETAVIPSAVVRIERPRRYVRFRASGKARVRRAPPPRSNRARRGPPPHAKGNRGRAHDQKPRHDRADRRDHGKERGDRGRSDSRGHHGKHHKKPRGGR